MSEWLDGARMTEWGNQSLPRAKERGMTVSEIPRPGQRYRHYKGGLYRVVAVGKLEATLADYVVYQSEDGQTGNGQVWMRPLAEWFESAGYSATSPGVPRFKLVIGPLP